MQPALEVSLLPHRTAGVGTIVAGLTAVALALSGCTATDTPTPIVIYVTPSPAPTTPTPSASPADVAAIATPTSTLSSAPSAATAKPTPKPTPRPTTNVYAAARSAYLGWVAKWKPSIDAANAQLMAAYGLAETTTAYGKLHQVFVGDRSGFINLRYPSACLGQRNYVVTNLTNLVQALANAALAPDSITLIGLITKVNSADDLLTVAEHDYKLCIGITS